jgi:hypothetical protein
MNAKRLNVVRYAAAAAVSCLALAQPATAFESTEQEMLRMENKFELRNGESLKLPSHGKSSTYRICVKEAGHAVPLKVTVDGKDREIDNGVCEDVSGARISIAPGTKLGPDMALMGRFQHKQ